MMSAACSSSRRRSSGSCSRSSGRVDGGVEDVALLAAGARDEHRLGALLHVAVDRAGTLRRLVVGVGVHAEQAEAAAGGRLHLVGADQSRHPPNAIGTTNAAARARTARCPAPAASSVRQVERGSAQVIASRGLRRVVGRARWRAEDVRGRGPAIPAGFVPPLWRNPSRASSVRLADRDPDADDHQGGLGRHVDFRLDPVPQSGGERSTSSDAGAVGTAVAWEAPMRGLRTSDDTSSRHAGTTCRGHETTTFGGRPTAISVGSLEGVLALNTPGRGTVKGPAASPRDQPFDGRERGAPVAPSDGTDR